MMVMEQKPALKLYQWPLITALALRLLPFRAVRWVTFPPRMLLPERALELWRERPDVQVECDITKSKGRRALARWFVRHGIREFAVTDDAMQHLDLARLNEPFPRLPQRHSISVSWLMRELARPEGYSGRELRTSEGQEKLLSWIYLKGLAKHALLSQLTKEQADWLLADAGLQAGVPRLLTWLWKAETALWQRFSGPDDPRFSVWLRDNGARLCPILAHPLIDLADGFQRRRPDSSLPFGINLIGHARGRLGVGEDVRMAAKALSAVKIPFVIRDFPAGDNIAADEDSVRQHLSEELPYSVTMFCTTGMETLRALTVMGREILDRRWAIGFWPWELPEWPAIVQHAYTEMDEIWASTRYTYGAYALSSPVPVRHQPMVVSVDETLGSERSDFGLPLDRFLFAFAYDGLSHATRKNPEASVAAFDRAFPAGDESVGLVIKGHRVAGSTVWSALEQRALRDPRIFLFDESLPRAGLLDLYRAIDCFVSLHRAEGFGRNIAECMALGKPVVVTAHSGNMDFTTHDTAALVPARLRALAPGDYPFGSGQHWAEPDLDAAAAQLRKIVANPRWRTALAGAGAELIKANYSPLAVGNAWAKGVQAMIESCEESRREPSQRMYAKIRL